jgi:hypothetical protein
VERDVLNDAVALVEDPEHSDALRHRGDARLVGADRDHGIGDHRGRRIFFGRLLAAGCDSHDRQDCERSLAHVYSGIHGW